MNPIENSHDRDALGMYGTCLRILKEVHLQTTYLHWPPVIHLAHTEIHVYVICLSMMAFVETACALP